MGLLDDNRLQADGVETVWFKAWKYDGKEAIWNALIQQIFYTMRRAPGLQNWDRRKFRNRVAHAAGELAKYAARIATRSEPPVRALYEDYSLRTFLERRSEIHCPAEQVKGWIELTKGQRDSVKELSKGVSG
jgi:hypothetical protein